MQHVCAKVHHWRRLHDAELVALEHGVAQIFQLGLPRLGKRGASTRTYDRHNWGSGAVGRRAMGRWGGGAVGGGGGGVGGGGGGGGGGAGAVRRRSSRVVGWCTSAHRAR